MMTKTNLTSRSIKNNNRYNILKSLVEHRELQRSELTTYGNVSVITVKKTVDELLSEGILKEAVVASSIGRKPKELSFVDDLGCFCCINLSKTSQIGYYIYDIHNRLLGEGRIKVSKPSDFHEALDKCVSEIQKLVADSLELDILGIAVSVPSIYYEESDSVNSDLIPGLEDINLKGKLSDFFGINNVIIIHDVCANAGLEYQLANNGGLYYLYIGDGLGSAFVRNGEIFQGDTYAAGEIGQCLVVYDGEEQCYENILSSTGLCRQLGVACREELEDLLKCYPDLPDHQIKAMGKITDFAAGILYNICWLLNPGTIVIDSSIPMLAELIQKASSNKAWFLSNSPIYNTVNITLPKEKNHYSMPGCVTLLVDNWIEEILEKI